MVSDGIAVSLASVLEPVADLSDREADDRHQRPLAAGGGGVGLLQEPVPEDPPRPLLPEGPGTSTP